MSNSPYQQLLSRHFSVWQQLSKQQQEALLENTMLMTYTKGRNLHSSSKDCAGLILVKSGMLRIYMLSDAGKEITLYRLNPGDICVLSASCVLSTITFEVHIDAECDTQALLIQAPFFSALCQQNIYVECFAYKLATERFSDVMWAMQQLLFMRMDQRLALF
ncbi:MAG: cyclic nucleotide-binding domain-containing protein, partial [Clostridiales bacterium]